MLRSKLYPFNKFWAYALALVTLLTLGLHYAVPVKDTDLWWQMAYGRYMLGNRTLVPDHSAFTWTPADTTTIYVAWVAEISLYLIHKAGGLPLLFIFRYMCLGFFVMALFLIARRMGVSGHPIMWLAATIGVLMSQNAIFIKPEIFSYVYFTTAVSLWIYLKNEDETAWKLCYIYPALVVLWINSHAGFMFGGIFIGVMFVGEMINGFIAPENALPAKVRKHLFFALMLCALALLATPYGPAYPLHLVERYLSESYLGGSSNSLQSVFAYRSIFAAASSSMHYVDYMVLSAVILVILMGLRLFQGRPDFAIILTNLVFAFIFTRYLRTTYFWAPIFSLSAIYLLAQSSPVVWPKSRSIKFVVGLCVLALAVFLGGRSIYDTMAKPISRTWFGFGASYYSPVSESKFIKENLAGYKLGNDYGIGGYLVWDLWPDTKAFIDPRYFPFLSWYDDYRGFVLGKDKGSLLEKFPAQVWILRYGFNRAMENFLSSPDWRLVFFGPSAAVFIKSDMPILPGPAGISEEIDNIKNLDQALMTLQFTTLLGDYQTGKRVMAGMKKNFKWDIQKKKIVGAENYLEGMQLHYRGKYADAAKKLEISRKIKAIWNNTALANSYNQITRKAWAVGREDRAWRAANSALMVDITNAVNLYNAGVVEWWLTRKGKSPFPQGKENWQPKLKNFLAKVNDNPKFPASAKQIASQILAGSYSQRPPIISLPPMQRRITK